MRRYSNFIPVSLGNPFYSSRRVELIVERYVITSRASIFFVCDRLRYLALKAQGEEDAKASIRVLKITSDTVRMIEKSTSIVGSRVRVVTWEFVECKPMYRDLVIEIERMLEVDEEVKAFFSQYLKHLVWKFYSVGDQNTWQWQRRYIVEETAVSIYMTEVAGYNHELYVRHEYGLVDFLYKFRREALRSFLGKKRLMRRFVDLAEALPSLST